jgi:hypothetical protein
MRSTIIECRRRAPSAGPGAASVAAVVVQALMLAGVVLLPVPALVVGVRGLRSRSPAGDQPGDRLSRGLVLALRVLGLLVLLALTGLLLTALSAALARGVRSMPALLWEFFALDLLLGAVVLLSAGRRGRRPARRRASPAAR